MCNYPYMNTLGQKIKMLRDREGMKVSDFAKAIGVSNFKEHHLDEILQEADITPMVNQVEYHPLFQQKTLY